MAKIFITGATGYIGGDALYALLSLHPELESRITALARNSDSASKVAKVYPKVKFAYGTLDDHHVLKEAASEADIVLHFADCDHVGAAEAIAAGLSLRVSQNQPAYWIHTSGTGILTIEDLQAGTYGEQRPKVYDDWDNVHEVTSLPDEAWHRPVDKTVLAAAEKGVLTAIVAPPTIYDAGRGPGNQRSIQWCKMAACAMKRGKGFYIGKGENVWTHINVHDLSALYVSLTKSALDGNTDASIWGPKGYFFAENGEYIWGDMAKNIAAECHKQGFLDTAEVDSVTPEEATKIFEGGKEQWGLNSRAKAVRATKMFSWKPQGASPHEALPGFVQVEAEAEGLVKHHAQTAAGN